MTNNQINIKNNIPIYVEQKIIQTDLQAQDILKTRTPIPSNFLKLVSESGNYCGSTNPKWKDKPLSERFGFSVDNQWIQLDIPHNLMKELDLPLGEDITPFIFPQPH